MSIYQTLLNLITRPTNIPLPPYPAPPEDMTLETAQAKHDVVLRLLPAFSDDPDFQTYLHDYTAYQLRVVRRRVEAKLNDLQPELPLKYQEMPSEPEIVFSN